MSRPHEIHAVMLSLCFLSAGCGGLVSVQGIVMLEGKPLAGASVSFVPEGPGRLASAVTDDDGRFTLSTTRSGDGIAPGWYRVVVTKLPALPALPNARPATPPAGKGFEPEAMATTVDDLRDQQKQSEVPPVYRDVSTSPLKVEIRRMGNQQLELNLERGAKK